MKVLSVNRALPRIIVINGKEIPTGIYKLPTPSPVPVGKLGLEGDGQADLTVHGGEYQAVYAYPIEHYAHWESELDMSSLEPGTFGENITTSGLLETDVCIGDIHRIGDLILQVTCERLPCFKLAHKLRRPDLLKPFLQSGRSGFYYRVLQEAEISAGTAIEIVSRDPSGVTVRDLLGMHRLGESTQDSLRRALAVDALSPLVRLDLEARLEAA